MQKRDFKDNPLIQHCLQFSLDILAFAQKLEEQRKFALANQLLKSGTSIGANIMEAQSAESRGDFYHKLKIAADYPFEAPLQKSWKK